MPDMIGEGMRLPWRLSPLEALRRWPRGRRVLLLHSGRLDPRWARYSILAEPSGSFRYRPRNPRKEISNSRGESGGTSGGGSEWVGPAPCPVPAWTHNLFDDLDALAAQSHLLWVGYLGYDTARLIESLPSHAAADRDWPWAELACCQRWLIHDGVEDSWHACGSWGDALPDLPHAADQLGAFAADAPTPQLTRDQFERIVAQGHAHIAAGDVFQVNLAQRFTADFTGDTRTLFHRLATQSPAWYGAYVELGDAGQGSTSRTIASTSPELFLEVRDDGHITTRPIKGTRPAAADPEELRRSEKDAAELHMIVDLMRNDLGRVARFGSVRVDEARRIESHPTVHHGVATITAQLRPEVTLGGLLRATLPGGSITGAPKVRAMQIIDELEPSRRGPYCGAIGYIHGSRACFNIAIRTLLLERDAASGRGRADFSVGGGIVADSTPAGEYQETLDKAQALIRALRGG